MSPADNLESYQHHPHAPGPFRAGQETMLAKTDQPRFLSRDLGLLAFNRRVLAQAADRQVPLLERLRFLCIVSSNLDELFEIRVAELKERIKLGEEVGRPGEATTGEIFPAIVEQAHAIVSEQYRLLNAEVLPELSRHGVRLLLERDWSKRAPAESDSMRGSP